MWWNCCWILRFWCCCNIKSRFVIEIIAQVTNFAQVSVLHRLIDLARVFFYSLGLVAGEGEELGRVFSRWQHDTAPSCRSKTRNSEFSVVCWIGTYRWNLPQRSKAKFNYTLNNFEYTSFSRMGPLLPSFYILFEFLYFYPRLLKL